MRFEAKEISWKKTSDDEESQRLPSYYCGFEGCSVRYDLLNGYFTVVLPSSRFLSKNRASVSYGARATVAVQDGKP
jgi:hypothetical protein